MGAGSEQEPEKIVLVILLLLVLGLKNSQIKHGRREKENEYEKENEWVGHSARRASMGETSVARREGMKVASRTTTIIVPAAMARTPG